jgi:hypothetical protein
VLASANLRPLDRNEIVSLVPGLQVIDHHERPVRNRGVVEFNLHGCGLARAVRPEVAGHFSGVRHETHIVDGGDAGKAFTNITKIKHGMLPLLVRFLLIILLGVNSRLFQMSGSGSSVRATAWHASLLKCVAAR